MLNTTIGQIMVNDTLPSGMRDYHRKLDKKGVKALLTELEEKHPDQYRTVSKKLMDVGRDVIYTTGGMSFGIRHLETATAALMSRQRLNAKIERIMARRDIPDDTKEELVLEATAIEQARLPKEVLDESVLRGNPLADQVRSGMRGSPANLSRLIGGDMLYADHKDNPIPIPATASYSEGLSPAEWFAASFGARKGLIDVKFATQDAGFFAKQLNQVAHRLMTTAQDDDEEDEQPTVRGFPADVDDPDNEGALLAREIGGYPRNTTLTPKVLNDLRNKGHLRILTRSPTVGGPANGGVYSRDVGVRERGGITPLGDSVGLAAAQALSERLTQGQLNSKHAGGVKGAAKSVSGFQRINQLIQTPKNFKGGAAHSQEDGTVEAIRPAPTGGTYVHVAGKQHYVSPGFDVLVKKGDKVEAGDIISEGMPNPAEIVQHKGIGEGRRYFVKTFLDAYRDSGMPAHRRNVELIARGLIDHVELDEETEDNIPGDVVSYHSLERNWRPREGFTQSSPSQAMGKYLERPVLHYSIGTKIRPSMLRDFDDFGVKQLDVHPDPPPFRPTMIRAMAQTMHDKDWLTRMLGSNQKKGLIDATHRGAVSDQSGTSFVPAMAEGVSFGKNWTDSVLKPQQDQKYSGL